MSIQEFGAEASLSFCQRCSQDDAVELINSALHRLMLYKERLKAIHLLDVIYRTLEPFTTLQLTGDVKSILVVAGSGLAQSSGQQRLLHPSVFLVYDTDMCINSAEAGLSFYEGTVCKVDKT